MYRFCTLAIFILLSSSCHGANPHSGSYTAAVSSRHHKAHLLAVPSPSISTTDECQPRFHPGLKHTPVSNAATTWHSYSHQPAAAQRKGTREIQHLNLQQDHLGDYGTSYKDLAVEVLPETVSRLHVKITPTRLQRWEVPESIVPRPAAVSGLSMDSLLYAATTQTGSSAAFALTVKRKANGLPIFDTRGHRFVFKEQYIELTTNLPADADLYGLGEVTLPTGLLLPRDGTVITLWNRDLSASEPYVNLYSSHPFYLQVNSDGFAHGVLFLNSNGMDVVLNRSSLTYKVIGGLVDLYFFMGPTPEEVIKQYHQVIGAPAMPPYWALGAHQGKWGYSNVSVLEQVVANYTAAKLPLECIWVDIEYMRSRFQTMTFDEVRYPVKAMRAFADSLHAAGQKWVPIQDAGIAVAKGYKAYEEGNRDNVWIQDYRGKPYLGQVWPGEVHYPDYLSSPNATSWLQNQLQHMYNQVPFDGLWLDMSEASNFCSGMTCTPDKTNKLAMHWLEVDTPIDYNLTSLIQPRTTCQMRCEQAPRSNKLAYPPYSIHNFHSSRRTRDAPISSEVIHPTARHADGTLEYDAHSLYGTAMAKVHYEAFTAITKTRPFMILRSTFPGAGRWTGHWTGDNRASWQGLFESIASTLNPQFWGMPMSGPDICGFIDTAKASAEAMGFEGMSLAGKSSNAALPDAEYEELCNRWTSAGAFYPYSRNHMGYFARDHEPYRWPAVAAAAKKAYGLRYQLLTYLHGELFLAHSQGGTLARPLLFADPTDLLARNASQQWMMGEAVLISPVITPNTTTITPHFTAGTWYSAWDYSRVRITEGKALKLHVPLGDVAVHYRGGSIIPVQPTGANALVTRDVRYSPVTLVVTLPHTTADHFSGVTASKQGASLIPRAVNATTLRSVVVSTAGAAAAQPTASGGARVPLMPYQQQEVCTAAYGAAENANRLVSCGLLYVDADTLEVATDNTVQVWYTAITAADGLSGSIANVVKSKAGEAAGQVRLEAIHIAGVAAGATGGGAKMNTAVPTALVNGEPVQAEYNSTMGVVIVTGFDLDVGQGLTVTWQL